MFYPSFLVISNIHNVLLLHTVVGILHQIVFVALFYVQNTLNIYVLTSKLPHVITPSVSHDSREIVRIVWLISSKSRSSSQDALLVFVCIHTNIISARLANCRQVQCPLGMREIRSLRAVVHDNKFALTLFRRRSLLKHGRD